MNEMNFSAKMIGGALVGLYATPIKMQLGSVINGIVLAESFVPSPKLDFPGLKEVMAKYQAKAPELKIDPLGYGFVPFGYAAGQTLAQAVEATKSLDHVKISRDYMHKATLTRSWAISASARMVNGPSRGSSSPSSAVSRAMAASSQFRDGSRQVILWPPEYKTGDIAYPYDTARK